MVFLAKSYKYTDRYHKSNASMAPPWVPPHPWAVLRARPLLGWPVRSLERNQRLKRTETRIQLVNDHQCHISGQITSNLERINTVMDTNASYFQDSSWYHKCSITQCGSFLLAGPKWENIGEPKKLGTKTTWILNPSQMSGHPRIPWVCVDGIALPKTRRWQSKSRIKPQLGY